MKTPSNEAPGFILKSLRMATGIITYPYVAWLLLLILVSSNVVYGWVIEKYLSLNSWALVQQAEIDKKMFDIQDEILKELRKTPQNVDNCQ